MTIQLAKIIERLQDLQKLASTRRYPVIRTFTWVPFLNFYLPALLAEDEFPALIYLHQHLVLSLTPQQYCTSCHTPLPDHPRPDLNMCSDCLDADQGRYVQCIIKGSGTGFPEEQDALGTPCDPCRDPLCKNPLLAERCAAPHIVYLATFNSLIKVGTARVGRWGFGDGYLLRLLEQGLDYAILFSSQLPIFPPRDIPYLSSRALQEPSFFLRTSTLSPLPITNETSSSTPGLSLFEAQTLETWILENFPQVTGKLTFSDKYTEILTTGPNPNTDLAPDLLETRQEADAIAEEILHLYHPVDLQKSPPQRLIDNIHGNLSPSAALDAPICQNPLDLVCTINYVRGNLVLAYHPRLGRDFWFNTYNLLGRGIVMEEPWT